MTSTSNDTLCHQCLRDQTIASTSPSPSVLSCSESGSFYGLGQTSLPWAISFLQHRKVCWGSKGPANNVGISVTNVRAHVYNTNQIQPLSRPGPPRTLSRVLSALLKMGSLGTDEKLC